MTKPLALLLYQNLLPGSQLINRLRDLGYRVVSSTEPGQLVHQARDGKPLIVFVDVSAESQAFCEAIRRLRKDDETAHVPVIAFGDPKQRKIQAAAREAGATLVVASPRILDQLSALLDQALQVE